MPPPKLVVFFHQVSFARFVAVCQAVELDECVHGQLICMWFLHESYHNTLNLYKPKLQECHVCRSDTVHLKIRFESHRLSGDIQHKDCPLQK